MKSYDCVCVISFSQGSSCLCLRSALPSPSLPSLFPSDSDRHELQSSLRGLVRALQNHSDGLPFLRPVSKEEAPDYYDVIKEPIGGPRLLPLFPLPSSLPSSLPYLFCSPCLCLFSQYSSSCPYIQTCRQSWRAWRRARTSHWKCSARIWLECSRTAGSTTCPPPASSRECRRTPACVNFIFVCHLILHVVMYGNTTSIQLGEQAGIVREL